MTALRIISWLFAVFTASIGLAQVSVVSGTSETDVPITVNFNGQELLVYAAIENPRREDVDAIIQIEGPSKPMVVHEKARVFGFWINRYNVDIDAAPSLLAIASNKALGDVITETDRLRQKIGYDYQIRLIGVDNDISDSVPFQEAVARLMQKDGLYFQHDNAITIVENRLLSSKIPLPSNIIEGIYKVRVMVLQNGEMVSEANSELYVTKAGLESSLFNLAMEQPWLYGILSIIVAIVAAILSQQIGRLFRS